VLRGCGAGEQRSSLLTGLGGLALRWEERNSCIGFPQPSKERTGIVDL